MIARLDSRKDIPASLRGAIVALGNFDGFHRGHQAVIGEALAWAAAEKRPCIVATFDPHPARYFVPDTAPFSLSTLDQRQAMFAAAGADAMLVFHFDATLANSRPDDWVRNLLHRRIGAAGLVTGADFTFGKNRSGNVPLLRRLCPALGMSVRAVRPVEDELGPVSSTRIRDSLRQGDCETATCLLTRPFAIRSQLQWVRGSISPKITMGLGGYVRPAPGTYLVTARLSDGRCLEGLAVLDMETSKVATDRVLELTFTSLCDNIPEQDLDLCLHRQTHGIVETPAVHALEPPNYY